MKIVWFKINLKTSFEDLYYLSTLSNCCDNSCGSFIDAISARVGIIMGSDSDLPVMKEASRILTMFGVAHEVNFSQLLCIMYVIGRNESLHDTTGIY